MNARFLGLLFLILISGVGAFFLGRMTAPPVENPNYTNPSAATGPRKSGAQRAEAAAAAAAITPVEPEEIPESDATVEKVPSLTQAELAALNAKLVLPPRPTEKRLAWFYHTTVDAYLASGVRGGKWDQLAVDGLWLLGRYWAKDSKPVEAEQVIGALKLAMDNGCTDPLVKYGHVRAAEYFIGYQPSKPFISAASQIKTTTYPAIRRAMPQVLAASHLWYSEKNHTEPMRRRCLLLMEVAFKLLPEVFADNDTSPRELYGYCEDMMNMYFNLYGVRKTAFDKIMPAIEAARPDSSIGLAFAAEFNTDYAWDARGSGWANTVTPKGWADFGERLGLARDAATRAYQKDPADPTAPTQMLTVALGSNYERPQMEVWFTRAMRADPDNLTACNSKLYYLLPRWHGSREAMLEFGNQCVQRVEENTDRNVELAEMLVSAHKWLAEDWANANPNRDQSGYWMQESVWSDVKRVFTLILERRPNSNHYHSSYASYASSCGKWVESNQQYKLITNPELAIFGTLEEFARRRAQAANESAHVKTEQF